MKFPPLARTLVILVLVGLNIGCDQITKSVARTNLVEDDYVEVIGENLILTKTENTGAFLSLGSDFNPTVKVLLLWILPALFMLGMLGYIIIKTKIDRWTMVGLAFIVGGGIGNLFDRIMYGSVTDFVFIDLGWAQTGIFNMADVSVCVGVGLIILPMLKRNKKSDSETAAA